MHGDLVAVLLLCIDGLNVIAGPLLACTGRLWGCCRTPLTLLVAAGAAGLQLSLLWDRETGMGALREGLSFSFLGHAKPYSRLTWSRTCVLFLLRPPHTAR